jgi:putative ABC transport system permease protein
MIWNAIILALSAIRRNLMRSTLTVLGIIIGVGAVILMVTLGNGATASVASGINSLGANMVMLTPGQHRGPGTGMREQARLFEETDVEALLSEIPGIRAVAPTASKSMQVIYGNANWSSTVYGVTGAYLEVRSWPLDSGREFSDAEINSGSAVCIIGATVRKQLFAEQDPVGNNIRLQSISCQVIGLLQSKGQGGMGMDQDDVVLIPLHAFQRRISGNRKITGMQIGLREGSDASTVTEEIRKLMRQRRGLQPQQDDDFDVMSSEQILSTLTTTMRLLTALLSAIAAISLLVGGIGIMNIMLVSVTERTREIGVRLAIGAFDNDVMVQFLVEAVTLSSLGGLIGIAFGLATSFLGCRLLDVAFVPDPQMTVLAFVFSALVGVVFGFFPARKAARLDPIDALRHE